MVKSQPQKPGRLMEISNLCNYLYIIFQGFCIIQDSITIKGMVILQSVVGITDILIYKSVIQQLFMSCRHLGMYAETGHLQKSTSKLPVSFKIHYFLMCTLQHPSSQHRHLGNLGFRNQNSEGKISYRKILQLVPKYKPSLRYRSIKDAQKPL